ncbi:MAG: hypothetical protein JSV78_09695 [Phycisphaerales bacterium]|nr:MAG: hypothetical protein JSV78_09695 [Phycisphaerales bacterium]
MAGDADPALTSALHPRPTEARVLNSNEERSPRMSAALIGYIFLFGGLYLIALIRLVQTV